MNQLKTELESQLQAVRAQKQAVQIAQDALARLQNQTLKTAQTCGNQFVFDTVLLGVAAQADHERLLELLIDKLSNPKPGPGQQAHAYWLGWTGGRHAG